MNLNVKFRGRVATHSDVILIKELISKYPNSSRTWLSQELCRIWNWVQPNGALRDMTCRGFLLELEKAGYIQLPSRKVLPNNPLVQRKDPAKIQICQSPIHKPLSAIKPIEIHQVRRTTEEYLYDSLIFQYHYLGFTRPVGEQLKYIVYSRGHIISCLAFSSAPRHIGCRDRYIGWGQEKRKQNIHLIAYNTRFLILPWVKVRYLASHILGKILKRIFKDWKELYNHPIYFLETFVDTERFEGTCYKAANWIYLGKTTGRGKNDHTNKPNRSIKAVWGYPLNKKFRELLNA